VAAVTRRRRSPAHPRPDYTRIAVLEWELFGVEPKPGTMAAAAVGMKRVSEALRGEPDFVAQYANPGLVGGERR
jgi:hypothetical protein